MISNEDLCASDLGFEMRNEEKQTTFIDTFCYYVSPSSWFLRVNQQKYYFSWQYKNIYLSYSKIEKRREGTE